MYKLIFKPWYSHEIETLNRSGKWEFECEEPMIFDTKEEAEIEIERQQEKFPLANGDFKIVSLL